MSDSKSDRPVEPEVQAAGGVLWRRAGDGAVEVVLVRRDRYGDWTLPKGKLEPGETHEEAALREVAEETTATGSLGPEIATTSYLDRGGRQKTVRYFAMVADGPEVTAAGEVDEARWFPLEEARRTLSYPRDLAVLDALETLLGEDEAGGPRPPGHQGGAG